MRAYIALITAMMLAALILPAAFIIATFGAAGFVASDLILSLQLFRMSNSAKWRAPTGWAIWGLYVGGQAMVLWGAGLA